MIEIKTFQISHNNISTKIEVLISINNNDKYIWYEIPDEYAEYITADLCDAYVVCLLLYAMENGHDIVSKLPITEQLYFTLERYLIPFLCNINKELSPIKITAETSPIKYDSKHIGTGISCGVDSLSTICYHGEDELPIFKIDTLTLLNTGYYGYNENNSDRYHEYIKQSIAFCKEHDYKLLTIDSNISNIIKYTNFNGICTYLTGGTILLLQKYFKSYYFSSGYPAYDFIPNYQSCAKYEIYLLPNISTPSLTFYSSCANLTRVEKTKLIAEHPNILKHLYVCTSGNPDHNCCQCEKCVRTLLAFEALNMTDKIPDNFNLGKYKKHRILYLSYMIRHRQKKFIYYNELYNYFKQTHKHIPFLAYVNLIPTKFEIQKFKTSISHTMLGRLLIKLRKREK